MAPLVDPFLVIGFLILLILVFVINVYVLVYWQHPEDKNESHLVRVLVVLGLQLSAICVLLLPVDVANGAGNP
jgi:LMBR1 domain-containing protein 1